jgi:hypothetical protein
MSFEGGSRNPRLVVEDALGETSWDVTNPDVPVLLRSISGSVEDHKDLLVVHTAKRVGAAPTPNVRLALERMRDRGVSTHVVGSPRVGGVAETLYVRAERGAKLFDISRPEQPREIHVYEDPAWYEGVAMGGNLMARHNTDPSVVEIYRAAVIKYV